MRHWQGCNASSRKHYLVRTRSSCESSNKRIPASRLQGKIKYGRGSFGVQGVILKQVFSTYKRRHSSLAYILHTFADPRLKPLKLEASKSAMLALCSP